MWLALLAAALTLVGVTGCSHHTSNTLIPPTTHPHATHSSSAMAMQDRWFFDPIEPAGTASGAQAMAEVPISR
jgi:hypothetical protein